MRITFSSCSHLRFAFLFSGLKEKAPVRDGNGDWARTRVEECIWEACKERKICEKLCNIIYFFPLICDVIYTYQVGLRASERADAEIALEMLLNVNLQLRKQLT